MGTPSKLRALARIRLVPSLPSWVCVRIRVFKLFHCACLQCLSPVAFRRIASVVTSQRSVLVVHNAFILDTIFDKNQILFRSCFVSLSSLSLLLSPSSSSSRCCVLYFFCAAFCFYSARAQLNNKTEKRHLKRRLQTTVPSITNCNTNCINNNKLQKFCRTSLLPIFFFQVKVLSFVFVVVIFDDLLLLIIPHKCYYCSLKEHRNAEQQHNEAEDRRGE